MNKEIQKPVPVKFEQKINEKAPKNPPQNPPALAPEIQQAINAAVGHAVKEVINQMKPVAAPIAPAPKPQTPQVASAVPESQNYTSKLKGIPVEPGQDLRHVHPSIITKWFNDIENRWKEKFRRDGAASGTQASVSWTRG